MSYQKTTIKKVINDIDQKKYYLPSLQRKFVWEKHQIELLFDSLMRNYPIGTFLFWRLHRLKAETYVFYEFLTEYDARSPYNHRKTGAFTQEEIMGVLDGQQRLSSMYIGLMGTHTEKAPYKRSSNPDAYEKMALYLNLFSLPYEIDKDDKLITIEDQNFEFKFLTEEKATSIETRKVKNEDGTVKDEPMLWMKVGKVLSWDEEPEFDQIIDNLLQKCPTNIHKRSLIDQKRLIKKGLDTLHKRIYHDEIINYFEVAKDDLEDILKIFVRVNSGGTVLSKTDLLFSTIVATWDEGRENIENLLKKINAKGDGFSFNNEYLMRCCLVLSDGPVLYKVNSFKSENVEKIRNEWPKIAKAVEDTVDLLFAFGFNGSVLTSQNATILIAYYLYKGGDQSPNSKANMRKYLLHALLKQIFSSSQDQLITVQRNAFRQEIKSESGDISYIASYKAFSFDEVLKIDLPQQKSLKVTEEDIERFLQYKKGASSFFVLSLLYPQLRYNEVVFHQDHIHPESSFNEDKFKQIGIPKEQWSEWLNNRDSIPNLQLMKGQVNESKNATPFKIWFEQMSPAEQSAFSRDNYLPDYVSLDFQDFMLFYEKRKDILRKELKKVLAITDKKPTEDDEEWSGRNDEIEVPENWVPEGAKE